MCEPFGLERWQDYSEDFEGEVYSWIYSRATKDAQHFEHLYDSPNKVSLQG